MSSIASKLIVLARNLAYCNIIIRLHDEGHPVREDFSALAKVGQKLLEEAPQYALASAIALADYNSDEVKILEAERDRRLAAGEWQ